MRVGGPIRSFGAGGAAAAFRRRRPGAGLRLGRVRRLRRRRPSANQGRAQAAAAARLPAAGDWRRFARSRGGLAGPSAARRGKFRPWLPALPPCRRAAGGRSKRREFLHRSTGVLASAVTAGLQVCYCWLSYGGMAGYWKFEVVGSSTSKCIKSYSAKSDQFRAAAHRLFGLRLCGPVARYERPVDWRGAAQAAAIQGQPPCGRRRSGGAAVAQRLWLSVWALARTRGPAGPRGGDASGQDLCQSKRKDREGGVPGR